MAFNASIQKLNRIPKKIHYCWFGKNPIPNDVKKCIKSWMRYCPDYEIIQWNESNFDVNSNKFIKKAYVGKSWAFVSDYARLKIIYENGGIYLDTDVELLKSLDPLLENECYFATQQIGSNRVNTGLGFGAIRGNKIIKEMLDDYDNVVFEKSNMLNITCPVLNTNTLKKYGYVYSDKNIYMENIDVMVYSPKYFDPISPGKSSNLLNEDTFSIHHYDASWTSATKRIKRKISRLIGQKNINSIRKILGIGGKNDKNSNSD